MPKEKNLNKLMRSYIDSKGIKLLALSKNTNIKYNLMICYFSKNQKLDVIDYFKICDCLEINPKYFVDLILKGE